MIDEKQLEILQRLLQLLGTHKITLIEVKNDITSVPTSSGWAEYKSLDTKTVTLKLEEIK